MKDNQKSVIELCNETENYQLVRYEWKTDKETWSKISCSLKKRRSIDAQGAEPVKVWSGYTSGRKVHIKIASGYLGLMSPLIENLILKGEPSSVQELLSLLTPTEEEKKKFLVGNDDCT